MTFKWFDYRVKEVCLIKAYDTFFSVTHPVLALHEYYMSTGPFLVIAINVKVGQVHIWFLCVRLYSYERGRQEKQVAFIQEDIQKRSDREKREERM